MTLANNVINELSEFDYCKAVPYQIKRLAVKDAHLARATSLKKLRKGEIAHFKLKFRNRKELTQSCYIPKSALSEKGIYHTLTGTMKFSERKWMEQGWLDCRLMYDSGKWFLCVPVKEQVIVNEKQEHMLAIDPGIRTFNTVFTTDGYFGGLGYHDFNRIFRLCKTVDKLISKRSKTRDRVEKIKLKSEIMRLRCKIKNLRTELHCKLIKFYTDRYKVIIYPDFNVSEMVVKGSRKMRKKNARQMLSWCFYDFEQRLIQKCKEQGVMLLRPCEAYTSKTNSFSGELMPELKGREWFMTEGVKVNRDINGARNILIRALRDSSASLCDGGGCTQVA